jgi:hypothetical protein
MGRLMRHVVALLIGLALGGAMHQALALPAGAVVPFNLAACPTGWSAVTDLAGRFPIGVGTLGSNTYALGDTGGAATHTLTVAEMPAHTHAARYRTGGSTNNETILQNTTVASTWGSSATFQHGTTSTGGSTAFDKRPPYYALLYCSLDADEAGGEGKKPAEAMLIVAAVLLFGIGWAIGKS